MALLLFLVCAVIGAVVLTAATASAGRFSDLAESDRRYYSVTSAVKLLRKVIENEKTIVEMTKTDNTYKVDKIPDNKTIFDTIVYLGVTGNEYNEVTEINQEIWKMESVDYSYTGGTLYLNVGTKESLTAKVTITADENCNLTVTVSSADAGEQFTQILIFTSNIDISVTQQTIYEYVTETKTVRVNWTLTEVK